MNKFLKRFSNFIVYVVTLLGIFAIFSDIINPLYFLIIITLVIFAGFVFLLMNHISLLEKQIWILKQKFIRTKELEDIRNDIKLLKSISKIK